MNKTVTTPNMTKPLDKNTLHPRGKSYLTLHKWMSNHWEKSGLCDIGGECTRKRTEWALKKGRTYSRNREDYMELCPSHHRKYDYTDEQKNKMSLSRMGKPAVWRRRSVIAENGDSKIEFESLTTAAKHFGVVVSSVSEALSGRVKKLKGHKITYKI